MKKIKMLLTIIRSRQFAFKATKQEYHKTIRDNALKQLRNEIRAYKGDKTTILKLVA